MGNLPDSAPDARTGALLEPIELVTFDTFGTLVDWQKALPAIGLGIERMPTFLKESERRQRPDRRGAPFLGYQVILCEVGAALRPDLSAEEIARWARRFGELPFFPEVPAGIGLLGAVVDVGVVSNCDALHQIDVARRLGRPWDVTVVAEELLAYKPTDRAWDRAVSMVEARGYDRQRWLHVSAWDDYDLAPASARGVRTAHLRRPGGVTPRKGAVDLGFDDTLQLAWAVAAAKGGPAFCEIEARGSGPETLRSFLDWMGGEPLAQLRACVGVRHVELLQVDDELARLTVRLSGRRAHQRFVERDLPRVEATLQERFPADELALRRRLCVMRASL